MIVPYLKSDWRRIIEYPQNHLNDFCIFRDLDGLWHAVGIMGTGTWASEQSLFHSVSGCITGEYRNIAPILEENFPDGERPQKHAPFIIEKSGVYHLFYRRPPGTIYHLETTDPLIWKGLGNPVFEKNDARDVCVVQHENLYYMYYCQWDIVDGVNRSCIFARTSPDLEKWSEEKRIFCDLSHTADHSRLESPFVIKRPEGFYMFIRHRLMRDKCSTVVIFSTSPETFEYKEDPWIKVFNYMHAPEIVELDGHYYVARVSGPFGDLQHHDQAKGGWIDIAELGFKKKP